MYTLFLVFVSLYLIYVGMGSLGVFVSGLRLAWRIGLPPTRLRWTVAGLMMFSLTMGVTFIVVAFILLAVAFTAV